MTKHDIYDDSVVEIQLVNPEPQLSEDRYDKRMFCLSVTDNSPAGSKCFLSTV